MGNFKARYTREQYGRCECFFTWAIIDDGYLELPSYPSILILISTWNVPFNLAILRWLLETYLALRCVGGMFAIQRFVMKVYKYARFSTLQGDALLI